MTYDIFTLLVLVVTESSMTWGLPVAMIQQCFAFSSFIIACAKWSIFPLPILSLWLLLFRHFDWALPYDKLLLILNIFICFLFLFAFLFIYQTFSNLLFRHFWLTHTQAFNLLSRKIKSKFELIMYLKLA